MDSEKIEELHSITSELRGIRKSLEFIAMLEAYREGIPFAEKEQKPKVDNRKYQEIHMQRILDDWDIE